ncbi:MAG: hypothetical protein KJ814_01990, partial [Proteobacteria bacterium]|nr:hypothetical protein [Pseudomonadota bacterium]
KVRSAPLPPHICPPYFPDPHTSTGGIGSNPTPDLKKLQNVVDRMVWGADILSLPQRMFFAEKCFDIGEG